MVEATSPIDIVPKYTPLDKSTWDSVKHRLPLSTFQKNRARFFRLFKEKV